jgi:hypothetical protein
MVSTEFVNYYLSVISKDKFLLEKYYYLNRYISLNKIITEYANDIYDDIENQNEIEVLITEDIMYNPSGILNYYIKKYYNY